MSSAWASLRRSISANSGSLIVRLPAAGSAGRLPDVQPPAAGARLVARRALLDQLLRGDRVERHHGPMTAWHHDLVPGVDRDRHPALLDRRLRIAHQGVAPPAPLLTRHQGTGALVG